MKYVKYLYVPFLKELRKSHYEYTYKNKEMWPYYCQMDNYPPEFK